MSSSPFEPVLTVPFPPATEEAWRAMVAKTLKDQPFESLQKSTVEGLKVEPLYSQAAEPARFPTRPLDEDRAWDVRTLAVHPDPRGANAEVLRDLEGNAASVIVKIDPSGRAGVAVGSADGLAVVLKGVVPEFATIALDADFLAPQAADWLSAFAKASPGAKLAFHLDPLSAFAESGVSPGPIESHLVSAANVARRLADTYPHAQLFLASGRVVHEAGGGEALEVATAAAATVAYAKAFVRAGAPITEAFARITLGLCADADYFTVVAKLRAARLVFGKIAQACGANPAARLEVRSSRRMLAAKDAWTNMIRLTAAAFGAAVGGADAVVLGNFTDAIGRPTAFARRQSRNTQLVLMEEAHIGRVADPGAGSGYVERLTEEIARAAWADFQAIEAAGGLVPALTAGQIAEKVAAASSARPEPRIVGVTAFPPTHDAVPEVETATPRAVDAPSPRLPGPDGHCPPLAPIRFAQAYEAAK